MIDLGKKSEVSGEPVEVGKEENKVHYPSFYIGDRGLDLDDDMAGEEVFARVKLKIRRINTSVDDDKKKCQDCDFDVLAIQFEKSKKKSAESDLESDLNRQLGVKKE